MILGPLWIMLPCGDGICVFRVLDSANRGCRWRDSRISASSFFRAFSGGGGSV